MRCERGAGFVRGARRVGKGFVFFGVVADLAETGNHAAETDTNDNLHVKRTPRPRAATAGRGRELERLVRPGRRDDRDARVVDRAPELGDLWSRLKQRVLDVMASVRGLGR